MYLIINAIYHVFMVLCRVDNMKYKRPIGLDALLENQLGHLPEFHIYSLSTEI